MPPSNEKSNSKKAIKLTISPTWRGKKVYNKYHSGTVKTSFYSVDNKNL
jgi:hypothetical protein